jgi:outer membrane protein OmpA-like peptidoglycan-associated protein
VPAVPAVPAAKAYRFPVVYFEFGGSILSPEAKEDLRAAARALAAGPHLRLELRGHSDNAGTPQANERISALRAEAVKQFLVGQGIAASRLTTRALADRQPAATNATAEGRRANRRTELVPIH